MRAMAPRPSLRHVFLRLPPATVLLLLSTVLGWVDGHAVPLPRQTTTVEYHELIVVLFPPLPTPAPVLSPGDLRRRQEGNTICGYLGGNSDLPATCHAGSHCVLDIEHDVVGCCPNGGSCSTGVFTGCVDKNSGPRTEVNPYVYTCSGQDVCYLNNYAGGYHQYGCGSASDLATTVQTTAQGQSSLVLIRSSIPFTEQPITLSASSVSSSRSTSSSYSSSATSSSITASRTSSASTSSRSSTASSADTSTTSPTTSASPVGGANSSYTGAIVGGTIGGVAFLALLIALIFFLLRRHKNQREGPGPDPTPPPAAEYTSPMRSHGAAFAPLPTWQEEEEPQMTTTTTPPPPPQQQQRHVPPHNHSYHQYDDPYHQGNMTQVSAGGPSPPTRSTARPDSSAWPLTAYDPAHVAGGGPGQTPISDQFMVAHGSAYQREIDDFSREVSTTMQNANEEDTQPLNRYPPGSYAHDIRRGDRPLWQQTRRQSRNLMWM